MAAPYEQNKKKKFKLSDTGGNEGADPGQLLAKVAANATQMGFGSKDRTPSAETSAPVQEQPDAIDNIPDAPDVAKGESPGMDANVAKALITGIPILLGGLLGGAEGGATGAKAGLTGLQNIQDQESAELENKSKMAAVEADKQKLETDKKFKERELAFKERAQQIDQLKEGKEKEIKMAQFAQQLRREHDAADVTKNTSEIASQYSTIQEIGSKAPTAVGDMTLIFNYMKMLDPRSTVKEGEYAQAEQARGIPDTVKNLYNRAVEGVKLTDEQRRDFIQTAAKKYKAQVQQQQKYDEQFVNYANNAGIDPNLVITKYSSNMSPDETQRVMAAREKNHGPLRLGFMAEADDNPPVKSYQSLSDEEWDAIPDDELEKMKAELDAKKKMRGSN